MVYYVTICYSQLAGLKNILFDSWFASVFFPELYETFRRTHNITQFKFKFTIHLLSAFYCGTHHFTFLVSFLKEFFWRGLNGYVIDPYPPPPPRPRALQSKDGGSIQIQRFLH